MSKQLEPKADWMVGRGRQKESMSLGGIVLPPAADSQDEVEVIAVGPEVKRVKVGDVVIFTSGRSTRKCGFDAWLIRDEDVIATIVSA